MQQKTKLGINFGFRGWMLMIFEITAFLVFQAFGNFPMNMLADFYGGFEQQLEAAETTDRYTIEDEYTEEICPLCGHNLVVKIGKFGPFLACSGWKETQCGFTMPVIVEMPGKCPKCGGRMVKRTGLSKNTGKQYTYYCCEFHNSKDERRKCTFATFDVPVKDNCPACGWTMFKKAGRGAKKPYCINESCSNFTPEEKRGGWQKKTAPKTEGEAAEAPAQEEKSAKKTAAKKTAAKKTAATKKTAAAKKTTTKKTTTKKTTAKKTTAKKTAEPAE